MPIMRKTYFFIQLMGCSAPLLGALSVGNVMGYSSTLLQQLKSEDGAIKMNTSEEAWIRECGPSMFM